MFSERSSSIFLTCLLGCVVLIYAQTASADYDPESIIDGIPVISARSLSPEITGRYEAHRRSSEPDLEEVDDYDDDERQRGSSSNQHDTYENPAYGESRRAAREGEDIENFFDRHIGPNGVDMAHGGSGGDPDDKELAQASSNNDLPLLGPELREKRSDDPFEMAAAASSPLATIFQTLLNAHKRPIVIETSDLTSVLGADSVSANENAQSSSTSINPSSSSSTSSIAGSSPTVAALGATGQSLALSPIASYLSPIAAPSSLAAYGQQMMEQAASAASSGETDSQAGDGGSGDDGGQIQEIYIGRRPTIMNHFQSYSPSNKKLSQQSSNAAYWRGAPRAATMGAQSANLMMSRPQMMTNEQMMAYNNDYSRYPVAASYAHQQESSDNGGDDGTVEYNLSFGGGSGGGGSSGGNSGSSSGDDGPEEMSSLSVDSQAGVADENSAPQMPAYNRMRQMSGTNQYMNSYNPYQQPDHSQSQNYQQQLQNAYHQQQQQHAMAVAAGSEFSGRKGQRKNNNSMYSTKSGMNNRQQQVDYNQQQRNPNGSRQSHAARYHKDPSESVVQPINYGQFRPHQTPEMLLRNHQQTKRRKQYQNNLIQQDEDASEHMPRRISEGDWQERQKYLAMLNREITNSPRYGNEARKNVATWRGSSPGPQKYQKGDQTNDETNQESSATRAGTNESNDDMFNNVQSETRNPTRVFQHQSNLPSKSLTHQSSNGETSRTSSTNNANQLQLDNHSYNREPLNQLMQPNNIHKDDKNNNDIQPTERYNNGTHDDHGQRANQKRSNFNDQPITLEFNNERQASDSPRSSSGGDMLRNKQQQQQHHELITKVEQQQSKLSSIAGDLKQGLTRVKRDESDDRDDADDDGVWVEDDDDDDNSRQSSDVNETSQEPEEESGGDEGGDGSGQQSSYNVQPVGAQVAGISVSHPSGMITRPHSYEVSPDDGYGYGYGAYP